MTLGVLAVIGLVAAFSLSSTLGKRAETPGVLVAFWRMILVSVLWNAVLLASARRVTLADVRQVWLPGVFFGLNLAVFFAGVTHNSVANAAQDAFVQALATASIAAAAVAAVGALIAWRHLPDAGDADRATAAVDGRLRFPPP